MSSGARATASPPIARATASTETRMMNLAIAAYVRARGASFVDVAEAFEARARAHGEWPTRVDYLGREHDATFEELVGATGGEDAA